jgi:hypothetical protein
MKVPDAVMLIRGLWQQYDNARRTLARMANYETTRKADRDVAEAELIKHRWRLEYALGIAMSQGALEMGGNRRWVDPQLAELRRLGTLG